LANKSRNRKDDEWLERLLAGDHEAFAEFVDEYQEMVFLCCRTLGLREYEIEDAASETFMAAYKGMKRYRGRAQLSTWLWGIAYRQGINYLRKNRREKKIFTEQEQSFESSDMEASTRLENTEQAQLVWEAVGRLPKLWAVATVLFYREEKEIRDIAKIMRVRQNTVKTYLFRSRKRLKELLAGTVGEKTGVVE
jgi:RNA polymerase sigma-70 factor (ECF subfamily)